MMTKYPWFGPKRFGWGWRPVSWQGWLATILCAGAAIAAGIAFRGSPTTLWVSLAAAGALVAICLLTGTPPG